MLIKENYLRLARKFAEREGRKLKKNDKCYFLTDMFPDIKRTWIQSIHKDCDIGISKVTKIANVLGVTLDDLVKKKGKPHVGIAEEQGKYKAEYKGPNRRGIDRRKKFRRGADSKKKIINKITSDDTLTGKECIEKIINFLEIEILYYRKLKH